MERSKNTYLETRKLSVRNRILIFITIIVVVSNLILGIGTYAYAKNLIFGQVQEKVKSIAYAAAAVTDGDRLDSISVFSADEEFVAELSDEYLSMTCDYGADYIYALMLNEDGEPFFAATSDLEESADSIGEVFEMYDGMQLAFDGKVATDEEPTTDEWGTFLSGYAPIYDSANKVVGIVGADTNYSELLTKQNKLRLFIILIYMVIAAIMTAGIIVIARILKNGFLALNSKVEELADGSGDLNRKVKINSGDEFETIAVSINKFIDEVRNLAVVVAGEAKQSGESISEINSRVINLSANMEECAATSESISDSLDRTVENVNRMADMVKVIDENSTEASAKAAAAYENATLQKEKATDSLNRIQSSLRTSAEGARTVDRVQSIAAKIKKISDETRILTLNAQVEAARAGEAGRGFAVVASEMGLLNEQITDAVAEITDINDNVLASVNALIDGTVRMDEYLTSKVLPDYDNYALLGKEYGEMAENVSRDVSVLNDNTMAITEDIQVISKNVHDISDAVSNGAGQVTGVNALSNQIVDNMNRLMDTSMIKMVK